MRNVNYLAYDVQLQKTQLHGLNADSIGLKPMVVLEAWANAYGTGIQGSRNAFKQARAGRQKLPVLVDPFRQIYFFPTLSPSSMDCVWINAAQILSVKPEGLGCRIAFVDHSILCLSLGPRSIKRQLKRIETMRQRITRNVFAEGVLSPRFP
jgi:competence protein ComK